MNAPPNFENQEALSRLVIAKRGFPALVAWAGSKHPQTGSNDPLS